MARTLLAAIVLAATTSLVAACPIAQRASSASHWPVYGGLGSAGGIGAQAGSTVAASRRRTAGRVRAMAGLRGLC